MINGKRPIPNLNTGRCDSQVDSTRSLSGRCTNVSFLLSHRLKDPATRKRITTFSFALVGVSGATIKLDQFGDSEGNFSVLALKQESFNISNFTCNYQMKPVGQFQQGETLVSELFVAFQKIFRSGSYERKSRNPHLNHRTVKLERAAMAPSKNTTRLHNAGVQAIGGYGLARQE